MKQHTVKHKEVEMTDLERFDEFLRLAKIPHIADIERFAIPNWKNHPYADIRILDDGKLFAFNHKDGRSLYNSQVEKTKESRND